MLLNTSFAIVLLAVASYAADGFVLIPAGQIRAGSPSTTIDEFEMLNHPLTNAEYQLYVSATKDAAPLHWANGRIPAGIENHPVIFVNRFDVAGYLQWRRAKEKRVYRLPTASEFEYAQRGAAPKRFIRGAMRRPMRIVPTTMPAERALSANGTSTFSR